MWMPRWLSYLAIAHADLDQIDDAWRCIGEAISTIEATKERWFEAEVYRIAGEIALKSPEPDAAKAEAYFERALAVARQQQAKSWELRAAMSLARLWRDQGKVQRSARTVGSGLRVVHGGVRHARSEGGEGAAGGVGSKEAKSKMAMSEGSDISVLYREFADALTVVLAENAVGRLGAADLQGHGPLSNTTPTIARRGIFVRSKLPLKNGKPCKKLVISTRGNELRTPLARPRQGAASARTAGSGLRLVHGRVRYARSEGGEGVVGGVGVMKLGSCASSFQIH